MVILASGFPASSPMSPAKIATRVKKAGYKTKSKSLANMVSNTLAQMAGVKKVGRGLYRA